MPRQQRTYTSEFKEEAIRLVETSEKSMSPVARDLGISDSVLSHWCKMVREQGKQAALLHHSDRGSPYTNSAYLTLLAQWGIEVRMSRKGDCFDNALLESCNSTLQGDCCDRHSWVSQAQARHAICEFIEIWYNRQRRHSALGYLSPTAYEQIRT